jgi:hypothetical protein
MIYGATTVALSFALLSAPFIARRRINSDATTIQSKK